jgi:hypothetical protein
MSDLIQQSFTGLTSPETPAADAAPAPAVDPVTESAPVADPVDPAADPVTDPATAPTDPAPAGEPAPLDFMDGEFQPDSVDADGRRHFYTKAKSERMQAAVHLVKELQTVMPILTPETVKERIEKANAADYLMTAYQEAGRNPAAIQDVLSVFEGESPEERQAFGHLVLGGLAKLRQVNPEALQVVHNVHNQMVVDNLRDRARNIVDPGLRQEAIALALRFEEAITGHWTPSEQWMGGNQRVDPLQVERQRFENEKRAFQEQQRQAQLSASQQWEQRVVHGLNNVLSDVVNEYLPPAKFEKNPYYEDMKRSLVDEIVKTEQANPAWGEQAALYHRQALLNPNEQNLRQAANFRKNIAQQTARRTAAGIVSRYSSLQLTNNQAAQQRAAQGVRTEPSLNGVGSPAPNGALEKAIASKDLRESLRILMNS